MIPCLFWWCIRSAFIDYETVGRCTVKRSRYVPRIPKSIGLYSYMSLSLELEAVNATVVIIIRNGPLNVERVYHHHNLSVEARPSMNIQCKATNKTRGGLHGRLDAHRTIVGDRQRLVAGVEVEVLANAGVTGVRVLVEVPAVEVLDEATDDSSIRAQSDFLRDHSLVHIVLAQAAA